MIIRCKTCGGALRYDIALKRMRCKHCDNTYEMTEAKAPASEEKMMEGDVFVCTSCAAHLTVNDVESATYCAYCGQPTIVFERVTKMRKPEKILPFTVTKEEAVNKMRERLRTGLYIPRDFKKVELERVCGIYIPFWIYDIDYQDDQLIHIKKNKIHYDTNVKARAAFKGMTIAASSNFCNMSSRKLEPYALEEMVEFDEAYLAGFYGDCYNQTVEEMEPEAVERCKNLYDRKIKDTMDATRVTIKKSQPVWEVKDKLYALLPAWFMTLRYKGKAYTVMVNGQSGKVIGAVPFVLWKVILTFILALVISVAFLPKVCVWLFSVRPKWVYGWAVATGFLFLLGIFGFKEIKDDLGYTTAQELKDFAEKRQEGDE